MNKLRFLLILFVGMLMLNACSKDDSRPWKDVNAESLTAQSNFDWNTTKNYQITITGSLSHIVKITSTNGAVYQKVFLVAGTACITHITLPAYEKSVQLVYNSKNIELTLTGPALTYSF
jgi:hypothetical protein